jgi:hypothetical protein
MSGMSVVNTNEDSVKRGKLISLALLIALSLFIQTLIKVEDITMSRIVIIGFIYFLGTFFGLIWAFNFEVKVKSLLFLLYSSLFVMSEYLFIQTFFAQKFSRIYEGILLLILIGLVFIGTYVSFLMTNVFNVNLYKNIPLVHVGRTTSYIISIFSVFFLTFSVLALQLSVYLLIPIVLLIYSFLTYIHLKNLGYEGLQLRRKTFLVTTLVLFMFLGSFLAGIVHEALALSPTVGYFVGIGVTNMSSKKNKINWELILYILALIIVIFINLQLNVFV